MINNKSKMESVAANSHYYLEQTALTVLKWETFTQRKRLNNKFCRLIIAQFNGNCNCGDFQGWAHKQAIRNSFFLIKLDLSPYCCQVRMAFGQ